MRLPAFTMTLLIAICPAFADTVELSGGGHLDGTVEQKADVVIVALDDELQVAIPASRVRRVITGDQLAAYRQRVVAAGEIAENHYQLAIWCVTDSNVPGDSQKYKRYHLRRAIELDPDHTKARAGLGYTRSEGKWILTSELMRKRGMITRGGSWELPESLAIEDFQEARDVESKKWIREVKRLVAVVLRGSSKSGEAIESLKAIQDPQAAIAISRQLSDSRENKTQSRALRILWVDLLAKFGTGAAIEALVRTGIDEPDEVVRERALDHLTRVGTSSAVATYLPMLKSNDNQLVNRAARALSWFPDPELALTYIEALVTTHKQQAAAGPGMQVGFGDGGGGLSTGGSPKVVVERRNNPAALTLVKTIASEADYGYDEQAWLLHFARERSKFSGDLRRDR